MERVREFFDRLDTTPVGSTGITWDFLLMLCFVFGLSVWALATFCRRKRSCLSGKKSEYMSFAVMQKNRNESHRPIPKI